MDDKDSKFDQRQRSTSTNIFKKISGREELDRAKARRYDPYFRIDLGLSTKNFKILGINSELYLQIVNATNPTNPAVA